MKSTQNEWEEKEKAKVLAAKKTEQIIVILVPLIIMLLTAGVYGIIYLATGHISPRSSVDFFYYLQGAMPKANDIEKVITFKLPISNPWYLNVLSGGFLGFISAKVFYCFKKMDYFPIKLVILASLEIVLAFIAGVKYELFSTYFIVLCGVLLFSFFIELIGGSPHEEFLEKTLYKELSKANLRIKKILIEGALMLLISALFLGLKIGFFLSLLLGVFLFIAYMIISILGYQSERLADFVRFLTKHNNTPIIKAHYKF